MGLRFELRLQGLAQSGGGRSPGAARAVTAPDLSKPLIGMTSLGKSALKYMVSLKPALEERGYEVAVFHATGMGDAPLKASHHRAPLPVSLISAPKSWAITCTARTFRRGPTV